MLMYWRVHCAFSIAWRLGSQSPEDFITELLVGLAAGNEQGVNDQQRRAYGNGRVGHVE